MIKKKVQLNIIKNQKKLIAAFIERQSNIILAISDGAVDGFSRGVAGALGVPLPLCLASINQARMA